MMNRNRMILALGIISVCGIVFISQANSKAIPKKVDQDLSALKVQEKPKTKTEYERLCEMYLSNIDQIAQQKEQRNIDEHKRRLEEYQEQDKDISKNEASIILRLRNEAKRSKKQLLDTEGPTYTNTIVNPVSAASARIFNALLKEGLVKEIRLVSILNANVAYLNDDWLSIVENLYSRENKDSNLKWYTVRLLYRSGRSRDKFRDILEKKAVEEDNLSALDVLFFDIDKNNGQSKVVQTDENTALAKKLSTDGYSPEIRATCAYYAAAIKDYTLAESICNALLSKRYKGLDNVDATPPEEDYGLFRARDAAMRLLFYTVRTESAFKTIYDISEKLYTEKKENAGKPIDSWVSFGFYPAGRMEVNSARSLIDEVESNGK
jgi:hypothetical protein